MTYAEQLNNVREYVRAGRNREWSNKAALLMRSKPLRQIAEELGMQPDAVLSALLECGWYDAVQDAERADPKEWLDSVARVTWKAKAETKKSPKAAPLIVNPRGWSK